MASEGPTYLKNHSLASLSPTLSHYHNQTDTWVQVRAHRRAEHMSFGILKKRHVYIRGWGVTVQGCGTYIYVIESQRFNEFHLLN